MSRIAFIGAGNIATCLIDGLVGKGHPPDSLHASNPGRQSRKALLARHPNLHVHANNMEAAADCDIVIVCVKPNVTQDVCVELAELAELAEPAKATDTATSGALFISVAAGVPLRALNTWLGDRAAVVRCMPNTPIRVGQGMCVLCANARVSTEQRAAATTIFSAVGDALWLDDDTLMDAVTAVSGSGPAYLFRVMEAMIAGACQLGLPADTARRLVTQTALGAASMAMQDDDLATLRQNVTSKGGTTKSGLRVMQDADIDDIFLRVLKAARQKARELAVTDTMDNPDKTEQ